MIVNIAQYGARHRYLIPQILNQHNILGKLYTDSHKESLLGKLCQFLKLIGIKNSSINRLASRSTNISSSHIISSDCWQLKLQWARILRTRDKILEITYQGGTKKFCRNGIFGDWLYAMYFENIGFTEYAKLCGVKIVADIYENPYIFKTLSAELETIPEYKSIQYLKSAIVAEEKLREKYLDRIIKVADVFLVPSEYVLNALKVNPYFNIKKAVVIPYISSVNNNILSNNPIPGRIIWIGNDPVRKGLVYALRAFHELKKAFPYLEFRVIGPVPEEIKHDKNFNDVHFTGYLNKNQLIAELKQADVYVFPTLAEGFAGTLLEAAAFGVPIITTHASGFPQDAPCLFVETKNSNQIISKLTLLLTDRDKRDEISKKLFLYSKKFSQAQYSAEIIRMLNTY